MKKFITSISLVLIMGLFLMGCGQAATSNQTQTSNQPTASQTGTSNTPQNSLAPDNVRKEILDIVKKYVPETFTYDYRKVEKIPGISYVTEEYKEILMNQSQKWVDDVKGREETSRLTDIVYGDKVNMNPEAPEFANINFVAIVSTTTKYEPSHMRRERGTLFFKKINGQWQIDADQREQIPLNNTEKKN